VKNCVACGKKKGKQKNTRVSLSLLPGILPDCYILIQKWLTSMNEGIGRSVSNEQDAERGTSEKNAVGWRSVAGRPASSANDPGRRN